MWVCVESGEGEKYEERSSERGLTDLYEGQVLRGATPEYLGMLYGVPTECLLCTMLTFLHLLSPLFLFYFAMSCYMFTLFYFSCIFEWNPYILCSLISPKYFFHRRPD
ncbi:hypothetical protein PDIG_47050 [Penicillium digitatum PHI26]|uniref:Uncharacterized protein n=2 Tax=Penicillium digitatum TaxID=36651 RepID=K9FQX3_PEND2|nr:hypothetical protein PDIP_18980 [Penicillium digitatum Pd1]EKV12090.1 hypothetical protein PDIG_47050 [Penicillium digitatum PHI26]EKV20237.1 hypothetical protein PDIP_18980 [Penicillium digitatum Pd1]